VTAAANAAPAGAATALRAVADGGRLATITGDPPGPDRGVTITNVYVRPDGTQLGQLATRLGAGQLDVPVAARYHLADAAQALAQATAAHTGGAITLTP
jgi:NADPH:quinone reductase-like Zn-dependent oxidoreductase